MSSCYTHSQLCYVLWCWNVYACTQLSAVHEWLVRNVCGCSHVNGIAYCILITTYCLYMQQVLRLSSSVNLYSAEAILVWCLHDAYIIGTHMALHKPSGTIDNHPYSNLHVYTTCVYELHYRVCCNYPVCVTIYVYSAHSTSINSANLTIFL